MSEYCSVCGGRPHPEDSSSHHMKWGRLTPPLEIHAEPEPELVIPDGPTSFSLEMPEDAPRNALALAKRVEVEVQDGEGYWKGKPLHLLSVAGRLPDGVKFVASWRKSAGSWKSDGCFIRKPGRTVESVGWRDLKGVVDERLA